MIFFVKKCISSFQPQDSLKITKDVKDFAIRISTNDEVENKVEDQDKPLPRYIEPRNISRNLNKAQKGNLSLVFQIIKLNINGRSIQVCFTSCLEF